MPLFIEINRDGMLLVSCAKTMSCMTAECIHAPGGMHRLH